MTTSTDKETDMEMLRMELFDIGESAMMILNSIETIEETHDVTCIDAKYWKEIQTLKRACKPLALEVVEVK